MENEIAWEPCLYFGEFTDSNGDTQWIILAVHVDDGYIVASDDDIIKEFHTTVLTFIRNATCFLQMLIIRSSILVWMYRVLSVWI